MEPALTGSYWVRVVLPAVYDAQRLLPRTRDRMILRRHALKLRYWPTPRPTDERGQVLDLDWCWVRALPGAKVGELRIDDALGDHDNLRLIFWASDEKRKEDPMPCIWVLAAMQKRRNDFSTANIRTFRARRELVRVRFYGR